MDPTTTQESRPSGRYRPQYLWLLMGPLLGAFSGAIVGTLGIWVVTTWESTSWSEVGIGLGVGLYLGSIFGGICGAAVGLVVGVPLVFLVGRHLPLPVARRRGRLLGAALPPVVLLVGPTVLLDAQVSWPHGEDWFMLAPLAATTFLGSRLAAWAAGLDALPTPTPDP